MRFGQRVDVNKVWAGAGPGEAPYRAWFSGYRFIRREGDNVLVYGRFLGGWVRLRYPARQVRASW